MKTAEITFTVFILISLLFVACSGNGKDGMNGKQPPVPVIVSSVVQKDVPVRIRAVGTVEPFSTVAVKPQVGGALSKVHFSEGQEVKKGDLLFTMDPKPFQAQLSQAEANLAADIVKAKNAREIANRYEGLVQKDFVTREQYDQYRATAEALEAQVEAEKAGVENARLLLNYSTIRSPINGRTGDLLVHEGNVVKVNETVMIDIHQIRPINIRFSVPGSHLPDIMKYNTISKLRVKAADEQGNPVAEGTLSFIDNGVDKETGTILLKGTFENVDSRLWPGEFMNVILTLTTRLNAIVVPTQAIETGQQGQFVFVVKKDMSAEQRPVVPGLNLDGETVIEQGLTLGENVVTDGQLRLIPGSAVEIKKPGSTESSEASAPEPGSKS